MSPATQSPKPVHDPYAAFRHPNYRAYTLGSFVSIAGQQMLRVAVSFEVYRQTHSLMALGFIGLSIWLPVFLFMLPGGLMADRYSRKKIVLATQVIYAATAWGLATALYTHTFTATVYILLFLLGTARAMSDPARQSLLPQLLPARDFPNAMTWNSTIFQTATLIGPVLGGALYAALGGLRVCVVEGFLELVFFVFVLSLKEHPVSFKKEAVGLKALVMGLKFVRGNKLILATITMDLFVVLLGGATALMPAFATDVLHCGSVGQGWLLTAQAMGAFAMSITLAHLPMKRSGRALLWAVAGFGAATIGFGLSNWFWLSFMMMFLTGAFDNISVIVRHTLVQVLTPDSMRGRVSAVSFIFIHSSNELGGFESGLTAAWFGLVPSVVIGGIGSILVVLAVMAIWPQVVRLKSLQKPV